MRYTILESVPLQLVDTGIQKYESHDTAGAPLVGYVDVATDGCGMCMRYTILESVPLQLVDTGIQKYESHDTAGAPSVVHSMVVYLYCQLVASYFARVL